MGQPPRPWPVGSGVVPEGNAADPFADIDLDKDEWPAVAEIRRFYRVDDYAALPLPRPAYHHLDARRYVCSESADHTKPLLHQG